MVLSYPNGTVVEPENEVDGGRYIQVFEIVLPDVFVHIKDNLIR